MRYDRLLVFFTPQILVVELDWSFGDFGRTLGGTQTLNEENISSQVVPASQAGRFASCGADGVRRAQAAHVSMGEYAEDYAAMCAPFGVEVPQGFLTACAV